MYGIKDTGSIVCECHQSWQYCRAEADLLKKIYLISILIEVNRLSRQTA